MSDFDWGSLDKPLLIIFEGVSEQQRVLCRGVINSFHIDTYSPITIVNKHHICADYEGSCGLVGSTELPSDLYNYTVIDLRGLE